MRAERLTLAPESGGRETVEALVLESQTGVAGDRKSAKDGSVSLLSGEAEERIRGLGGLCTGRFLANVVTRGLDYAALETGGRLTVGACELELVRVGKPCYEVCMLAQSGERCPLPKSCAFARVIRGGTVHRDDEMTYCGK
ncbi:MAG: MOSC domain-containing protein [Clostridiales bacterium]|nr:MOSC domain-containing protein [Clostridiales bacterium]